MIEKETIFLAKKKAATKPSAEEKQTEKDEPTQQEEDPTGRRAADPAGRSRKTRQQTEKDQETQKPEKDESPSPPVEQTKPNSPEERLQQENNVHRIHSERTGGGEVREGEIQQQRDEHNTLTGDASR
jgi:hypothetical protein